MHGSSRPSAGLPALSPGPRDCEHRGGILLHLTPHPHSEGKPSRAGTIAQYLEEQGAIPFMRAADAYFHWHCRAIGQLQALKTDPEADASDAEMATASAFRLLDMDVAFAMYCADHGLAPPEDIEARTLLHLKILDRQLAMAAGDDLVLGPDDQRERAPRHP